MSYKYTSVDALQSIAVSSGKIRVDTNELMTSLILKHPKTEISLYLKIRAWVLSHLTQLHHTPTPYDSIILHLNISVQASATKNLFDKNSSQYKICVVKSSGLAGAILTASLAKLML